MEGFGDLSILVTTGTPSWFQTAKKTNRPKARKKLDSIETRKCMTSGVSSFFFWILPGDSKWPFDPLIGGHLTPWKGHLTIPKRALWTTRLGSKPPTPTGSWNHELPSEASPPMQFICWTTVGSGWHWWMAPAAPPANLQWSTRPVFRRPGRLNLGISSHQAVALALRTVRTRLDCRLPQGSWDLKSLVIWRSQNPAKNGVKPCQTPLIGGSQLILREIRFTGHFSSHLHGGLSVFPSLPVPFWGEAGKKKFAKCKRIHQHPLESRREYLPEH